MEQKLYGGIELGGTKTICGIGNATGEISFRTTIPTTTTTETLEAIYKFFAANSPISALGVAAFGPLNLDTSSTEYGSLYNTPKPGWTNVGLKDMLENHFKLPVAIDLDVNCAALGELYYGAARDVNRFVYLTLGTGIGGGLVANKQPIHGLLNLEMGHIRIPHEAFDEAFRGACPFHGDCFEGIASGHALEQRFGQKAEHIADQSAWDLEASYIGSALNNIMMIIGPEKIVLGGGIMDHPGLIEGIREAATKSINGYLAFPDLKDYIVPSSGDTNGILGAIKLASLL